MASGLALAACSAATVHGAGRLRPDATTTTAPGPTTSSAPAPTTTAAPAFPSVVVQAMAQFVPLPAGALAPIRLPAVTGYLTAQTGGLGGQDNVTLVVTPQPVPVDSPGLQSAQTKELASFATTPTTSAATAQAQLAQQESQAIAPCGGPSAPVTLSDGTTATSCPTLDGAAITWQHGSWKVQVVDLGGTAPPQDEANQVASTLAGTGLPASDGGGIVSVQVPSSASSGSSPTAGIQWSAGADNYQVRSTDDPVGAIEVAAAMRPYPSG